jgi:short-subunit dehydrogenase
MSTEVGTGLAKNFLMRTQTALITGATSGIGLELARQFAAHGHPLVLTGRTESELHSIATELQLKYGISAKYVAADLEEVDAPRRLFAGLEQEGTRIDILVNNAGFGCAGKFWEIPLDSYAALIQVNVEAVVGLTRLFLPPMISRGEGRILMTASVAGFEPGPHLAVYHASKAFVLSLSEALAEELKGTGVTLTALCPGATDTDFFLKAGMVDTKIFQQGNVAAPQEVAQVGYEAMMKGDPIIVPGAANKALVFARRLLPIKTQATLNKKFYTQKKGTPRKRQSGDIRRKAAQAC